MVKQREHILGRRNPRGETRQNTLEDAGQDSDCCDMFKALSVETRVKIIEILKSKGPMGAKKMAEMIGITPAAVSQHLRMLKHVGLVRSQRHGYWIPYKIDEKAMEDCRSRMNQVCTFGHGPSHVMIMKRRGLRSVESLERYKKQLERELDKVNRRLEDLGSGKKT